MEARGLGNSASWRTLFSQDTGQSFSSNKGLLLLCFSLGFPATPTLSTLSAFFLPSPPLLVVEPRTSLTLTKRPNAQLHRPAFAFFPEVDFDLSVFLPLEEAGSLPLPHSIPILFSPPDRDLVKLKVRLTQFCVMGTSVCEPGHQRRDPSTQASLRVGAA